MKLLDNISFDQYNDINFILNYISKNAIIGTEEVKPIEYFHCFWKGPLSDLHLMSLQSLLNTHPNQQIILWTSNLFELNSSKTASKIKSLFKNNIQIIEIDKNVFSNANAEILYSRYSLLISGNNQHTLAYASDIIRFVVLQVYGGVWFDLDVLFLRNLNSIHLNQYVSQWGSDACGNAAILRLEKNHNLIKTIIKAYDQPFYPTTTFNIENDLDITIMPGPFFDILWTKSELIPENLQFKTFDDFFKQEELNLPKEIYAYHWHNRWSKQTPPFFKI